MKLIDRLLKIRRKVTFRKPRGCVGLCKEKVIYVAIKPRSLSPAQVYLHELLHAKFPKWNEKETLCMERYLWRHLTPHERYRLYSKLFRHPYTMEDSDGD